MLSIVIPLYNSRENIANLVESLLDQDFEQASELIIVDDCSSDGSFESLSYLKDHPKVRLFKNPVNK